MASADIIEVTDSTFQKEVLEASEPVVVDFTAPWCGPCKVIVPTLEEYAGKLKGKVKIAKVNVDDSQATAQRYRVMSLPTVIVFHKGQVAGQVIGAYKDKVAELIQKTAG